MGIHDKVEALLNQKPLAEKAAQTDMIRGVTMATTVHLAHHLTDNDDDSIALSLNAGLDVQGLDYPNAVWQGARCAWRRRAASPGNG